MLSSCALSEFDADSDSAAFLMRSYSSAEMGTPGAGAARGDISSCSDLGNFFGSMVSPSHPSPGCGLVCERSGLTGIGFRKCAATFLSLEQPLQHSLQGAERTPRHEKCATLKDKAVEVTKDFMDII